MLLAIKKGEEEEQKEEIRKGSLCVLLMLVQEEVWGNMGMSMRNRGMNVDMDIGMRNEGRGMTMNLGTYVSPRRSPHFNSMLFHFCLANQPFRAPSISFHDTIVVIIKGCLPSSFYPRASHLRSRSRSRSANTILQHSYGKEYVYKVRYSSSSASDQ